jgi:hypothetical protein
MVRFLMYKQSVSLGNYSTTTSNGVNQGSTLSPLLFDVYT